MTTQEQVLEKKEDSAQKDFFIPRADIFETELAVLIEMDVPGADDKSTEITLKEDELTVTAGTGDEAAELTYSEYQETDYRRTFRLPESIDREGITADVKHGVLKLTLPKIKPEVRKIKVRAE